MLGGLALQKFGRQLLRTRVASCALVRRQTRAHTSQRTHEMNPMSASISMVASERLKMELLKIEVEKLPEKMRTKIAGLIEDVEGRCNRADAKRTEPMLALTDSSKDTKRAMERMFDDDSDADTDTKTVKGQKKKSKGFKVGRRHLGSGPRNRAAHSGRARSTGPISSPKPTRRTSPRRATRARRSCRSARGGTGSSTSRPSSTGRPKPRARKRRHWRHVEKSTCPEKSCSRCN